MTPEPHPTSSHPLRRARAAGALLAAVALFGAAAALTAPPADALASPLNAGWSAAEQQFAYQLNRARWSPSAVAAAAGLAPGTFLPRPPLAVNQNLAASAQARSNEMAAHDYFAHQSPVTGLWPNQTARANGYELPDWWPDEANNIESLHWGSPDPNRVLLSFVESPNHRDHLMGQDWFGTHREIGVGLVPADRIWTIHTASRDGVPLFLTGVAYTDGNHNGVMDLGEGLGGITVTAGGRSTTTNPGGGWAIPTGSGLRTVTASGGGFGNGVSATVRVTSFNVGVDFILGSARSAGPRADIRSYSLCLGRPPTILGTADDDVIEGTPGADVIHGLGGNDVIHGLGGNDVICGGLGDDQLWGDAGDDKLHAGGGEDVLYGGDGDDLFRGRSDRDTVSEGAGDDSVVLH